jgi:transposase
MMQDDILLKEKYTLLLPHLDEKSKRLYLASEAIGFGRGGLVKVAKLSKLSRVTIAVGIKELRSNSTINSGKTTIKDSIRKPGGGRKKAIDTNKGLLEKLRELVCPHTVGDPMRALLWTSKSTRKLASELQKSNFNVSYNVVNRLLQSEGFSLQSNKKTNEGGTHQDRDAQFQHINKTTLEFTAKNEPVISVDCKKKELIGNFKNNGKEWAEKGEAEEVNVYDFPSLSIAKAVPYGVYDINKNEGWVSVGVNKDTAQFAVSSIRNWWNEMGKMQYSKANRIYINADGGGSNSSRSRLWKSELQLFATEINKEIHVSHFPPGTSKWNKIEHRMFSFISINWRAKPLINLEVIVNLISGTTTSKGLKIKSKLDTTVYEKGIKISDKEMLEIKLSKNDFHGEWNYIIKSKL